LSKILGIFRRPEAGTTWQFGYTDTMRAYKGATAEDAEDVILVLEHNVHLQEQCTKALAVAGAVPR
jgi:hypothetical protein